MKLSYLSLATILSAAAVFSAQAEDIQDRWVVKEKSKWSSIVSIDYSATDYDRNTNLSDRALQNRTLSGYGVLRYSLDKDTRLQAIVSGYHSYDNGPIGLRGDLINDMWLSYSRNNLWKPTSNITMSGEARFAIPLSKHSKRNDLDTAIRLGLRFSLDLSDSIDGLYLNDYIRARQNFHQYTTAGGIGQTQYSVSNIVALDYYFASKWSFSTNVLYRESWDYSSNSKDPIIVHSEQIGYQVSNNMDVALGITNSASYYSPERGPNPLDDLTDVDKSTFYFAINYLF